MERISKVLKRTNVNGTSITVNSNSKNTNTVNSKKPLNEEIEEVIRGHKLEPNAIAQDLAQQLDDGKSVAYYRILIDEHGPGRLFDALSYTKDAHSRGMISHKKATYFQGILRNWGLRTKFSKP